MKFAPLLVVMLAGCAAHTPQNIMEQATRYDARLKLPPGKAADCLARNAWNIHADFFTTPMSLGDDGSLEVVLRLGGAGVVAIIHLRPAAGGSNATSWWRFVTREEWPAKVVEGC